MMDGTSDAEAEPQNFQTLATAKWGVGPPIGIDLGTTYSCIAVFKNGGPEVVVTLQGDRTVPSYVAFLKDKTLVGTPAKNALAKYSKNVFYDVKRLIGRKFSDSKVQNLLNAKIWEFGVEQGPDDKIKIKATVKGSETLLNPEEISAHVLIELRENAERHLGLKIGSIKEAVVTVPAYFNESQRQSTKDAAYIAGIDRTWIVNGSAAASLDYNARRQERCEKGVLNVLVFDLGGGTYDCSVLELEGHTCDVIATNGNTNLGGRDFTKSMVDFCCAAIKKLDTKFLTPVVVRDLTVACENAKIMLSYDSTAEVVIPNVIDGEYYEYTFSVETFNKLNGKLFDEIFDIVKTVLEEANKTPKKIHKVVLVGGSSRIPNIQERLAKIFTKEKLDVSLSLDEAVCRGAAIMAGMIKEGKKCGQLRQVVPFNLSFGVTGGIVENMIARNTQLPFETTKIVTTSYDNQTRAYIDIYEGLSPVICDNELLGKFWVTGLPAKPKGEVECYIKFRIEQDGVLQVVVWEVSEGKASAKLSIKRTNFSAMEMQAMKENALRSRNKSNEIEESKKEHSSKIEKSQQKNVQDEISQMQNVADDQPVCIDIAEDDIVSEHEHVVIKSEVEVDSLDDDDLVIDVDEEFTGEIGNERKERSSETEGQMDGNERDEKQQASKLDVAEAIADNVFKEEGEKFSDTEGVKDIDWDEKQHSSKPDDAKAITDNVCAENVEAVKVASNNGATKASPVAKMSTGGIQIELVEKLRRKKATKRKASEDCQHGKKDCN